MKKVIFMLAAAALVVSCTKTEVIDMNADGVLIQAKPVHQLVDGSVSRAPYTGNIAIDNKLEAQVLTFKNGTPATLHANGLMNFASTSNPVAYASVTTGNAKFTTGGGDYTMYGLYPKGWAATATNATITFTGKEDVMATAAVATSEAGVVAGSIPSLTFEHQLTKLVVKVQAMDAAAATLWGNLEAITLTQIQENAANVKNTATYTLATGKVGFAKTGTDPMKFWKIDTAQAYTDVEFESQAVAIEVPNAGATNIVPVAYSMVAPFTPINDKDITLSVTTSTKPAGTAVNLKVKTIADGVTTAGYAYTITLTFTDEEKIVATANVVDWINGEDIGGVVIQ